MTRKLIVVVVFGLLGLGTLFLPDPFSTDMDELAAQQEYEALPDADLRSIAELEWEAGRKETALTILSYIIEENMGDAVGARLLMEEYRFEILEDQSAFGRFRAGAYGFVTGKVEDMSSLAGSSVADFIIYGDIRDLLRELVFEDDTDEIVVALSAAGIVTTVFPPAEGAVTATKALKKASVLSAPMTDLLKKRLKGFKDLGRAGMLERIKDNFLPFWDLAKHSKSWGEFTTMVRHCQNLEQVKFLSKLASLNTGNGRKLSQIFAVADSQGIRGPAQALGKQVMSVPIGSGKQPMTIAVEAMKHLQGYGQKGMDQLYAALRKGPAGVRFVAAYPTFTARTLKNVKKGGNLGLNAVHDQWNRLMVKHRAMAALVKYGMAGVLFLIAGLQLIPKPTSGNPRWKSAVWGAVAVSALLVFAILIYNQHRGSAPQWSEPFPSIQTGGPAMDISGYEPNMSLILMIVLVFNVFAYGLVYLKTTAKLRDIDQHPIPAADKLLLLETLEIYFDLPMYIGLALTIGAFLLITLMNAESARIFAYVSALCGIGVTTCMRVFILQKKKEALLHASMHETLEGVNS